MLSKIEILKDERPRVRRTFDGIYEFCSKIAAVNLMVIITLSTVMIFAPTIFAFLYLSENVRIWISSIIGGILSLVVIPLSINYIKYKQKKADELYVINEPLYQELSDILIKLLSEEYIIHGGNVRDEINTTSINDIINIIVEPLKDFICENYSRMCNTFSVSLIWNIIDVYNECLYSVTKYNNIRVKIRKCFRKMRRDSGAKGSFYINQSVITMLSPDNYKTDKIHQK